MTTAEVSSPKPDNEPPRNLTGEEQALYDRQIRLWGVDAQRQLATSSVLLVCDPASLLSQELAKNMLLAGIARLVLQSLPVASEPVGKTDDVKDDLPVRAGFLGCDADAVVKSLRDMNPLVDVTLVEDEPPLRDLSVICAVGAPLAHELSLADRCREGQVPFLCGRVAGATGWLFVDAGEHYQYTEPGGTRDAAGNMPKETARYVSYREAVDAAWGGEVKRAEFGWHVVRTLQAFEHAHGRLPYGNDADMETVAKIYKGLCEDRNAKMGKLDVVARAAKAAQFVLPPVTGIVGGLWGREAIKIVSGRGSPLDSYNFFFYNAATSIGSVERVGPRKA